jgi:hypothetical protein
MLLAGYLTGQSPHRKIAMSRDSRLTQATDNHLEVMTAVKAEYADTIALLVDAIDNRANADERAEIQEELDEVHSTLKDHPPSTYLDIDAWSQWVADEIANQDHETQLASAIAVSGEAEIRNLVLTRIAADRLPTL